MLPTYNEKENLESLVNSIMNIQFEKTPFQDNAVEMYVVIVDDNSPDGTGRIADNLSSHYKGKVNVIHRVERGRGTAGLVGLDYARKQEVDFVIEMDSDFSHSPSMIPQLISSAREHDIVIGSRFAGGGRSGQAFSRKLLSKCASLYFRIMFGSNIKDWQSGFRCFNKNILTPIDLRSLAAERYSGEYSIGIKLLYQLVKSGASYKEVPIDFIDRKRGKSKISSKQVWSYIYLAFNVRLGFH